MILPYIKILISHRRNLNFQVLLDAIVNEGSRQITQTQALIRSSEVKKKKISQKVFKNSTCMTDLTDLTDLNNNPGVNSINAHKNTFMNLHKYESRLMKSNFHKKQFYKGFRDLNIYDSS